MELSPTVLDYHEDMWKLRTEATILSYLKTDDGRKVLFLSSTIFHPQGGGQPSDTGFIEIADSNLRFCVQDVRSKDGVVFHYGTAVDAEREVDFEQLIGKRVCLSVDESRRKLNSRLHSAGHLLDVSMQNVGLGHLEPGKGYHFPDGPFVEYKGTVPQCELENKRMELELAVNALIEKGGKVSASIQTYEEAAKLCGGSLPDYISRESNPRIVRLAENPGCPCGGTHVADISEIISVKIGQVRVKKGVTKISYSIG